MSPLLSIVVPFHNVEAYLGPCLESIGRQTLSELEVVMVDDGSTDESIEIAREFADRDERFRLVRQENQGLGPARNTGVQHASGRYLAFMDSDDIVPRYAYELMVGSLEETGSDLCCGGVRRLTSAGPRPSPMHTGMFLTSEKQTHITQRPDLLGDRTAWNKVFRREFFDEHDFRFPSGLYEDAPVTIPAHYLAKSVDVLSDIVYYWREREGESQSITQRRTEPGNIEDRVRTIRFVSAFLRDRSARLWQLQMTSALSGELPLYIDMAGEGGSEYRERLHSQVTEIVDEADEAALRDLTALKRLKYHFIANRMTEELLELISYQQARIFTADLVRRDDRWYARYPYYQDAERAVPDELYDVTDELTLRGRVDAAHWGDDRKLRISGHAYITRIPMTDPDSAPEASEIRVWLQHSRSDMTVELPVQRVRRPDVSGDARRAAADYDWAGFTVTVDPASLRTGRHGFRKLLKRLPAKTLRPGTWTLHAEVTAPGGLRRAGELSPPRRSDMRWANASNFAPDVMIRPVTTNGNHFGIQVKRRVAHVMAARVEKGAALLDGRFCDVDTAASGELVLARQQGMAKARLPVAIAADGSFSVKVPVDVLVSHGAETAAILHMWVAEGLDWKASLQVAGREKPVRLTIEDGVEVRHSLGRDEIVVTRTKFGNLRILERSCRPAVIKAEWEQDGRLVLTGEMAGTEQPDHMLVRLRDGGEIHRFPMTWDERSFTAVLSPAQIPRFGEELPLATGMWGFFTPTADGEVPVAVARSCVADLPEPQVIGMHSFGLAIYQGDALRIESRPALEDEERGIFGLKRITLREYPAYRSEPLRDLALFESFRGRQYSDSPRAIYEEMAGRRPDLEYVWVSRDGQFTAPKGARTVLHGSREHFRVLAQAKYLVGNDPMPEWFAKRDGQLYIQTWHGTPLKLIGHDIERPQFSNAQDYLRRFDLDVAQWDALVSPNPFSTPIMKHAFRYGGEVLEYGYPRNDLLANGDVERATQVRRRLAIPDGKTVVLYAPTWRDDLVRPGAHSMDLQLDLDAARSALADDHVLLVRGHFNLGAGVVGTDGSFAIDVTQYPDIAELYLISDVLITDYSSVMFDFAVTGRPQLFYTYDLEQYRDRLRGFYFDLEAEAPGPLCHTSEELIESVRAAESTASAYAARYEAFRSKFCPWDDGGATARVVDRILRLP